MYKYLADELGRPYHSMPAGDSLSVTASSERLEVFVEKSVGGCDHYLCKWKSNYP
jgi:hypothetical protein